MVSPGEVKNVYSTKPTTAEIYHLKEQGNLEFRAKRYAEAVHFYSEAIQRNTPLVRKQDHRDICITTHIVAIVQVQLLANRAACYLKLEKYGSVIRDCSGAIRIAKKTFPGKPSNFDIYYQDFSHILVKALLRRAAALELLGNYYGAAADTWDLFAIPEQLYQPSKEMLDVYYRRIGLVDKPFPDIQKLPKHSKYLVATARWELIKPRKVLPFGELPSMVYYKRHLYLCGGRVDEAPSARLMKMRVEGDEKNDDFFQWQMLDDCPGKEYAELGYQLMKPQLDAVLKATGKVVAEKLRREEIQSHLKAHPLNIEETEDKVLKRMREKFRSTHGRFEHTAVVYKHYMYIYGGQDVLPEIWQTIRYDFKKDLWDLSGDVESPDAPILSAHAAVVCKKKMYVFGGRTKEHEKVNDLWSFDLKTHKWKHLIGTGTQNPRTMNSTDLPEPRDYSQMWCDEERKRLYIFGGSLEHKNIDNYCLFALDDLWCYDIKGKVWERLNLYGNIPAARCEYSAVPTKGGVMIFGGFKSTGFTMTEKHPNQNYIGVYYHDAFLFSNNSQSWRMIMCPEEMHPSKRMRSAMATNGDKSRAWLAGGVNGWHSDLYDDLYTISLENMGKIKKNYYCSACGVSSLEAKMYTCSGTCGDARYCSRRCQVDDWKRHASSGCKKKTRTSGAIKNTNGKMFVA